MIEEPTEPKMNDPTPVTPVTVSVIATDSRRAGDAPLTSGTVATTPDHLPNVVVNVVQPVAAISVRFVNLYLTTLVGLLVAAMTPMGGKLLYTKDFWHMVFLCGSLAFPGAFLGFLKDLITVFGRLEGKYPLATGSI